MAPHFEVYRSYQSSEIFNDPKSFVGNKNCKSLKNNDNPTNKNLTQSDANVTNNTENNC